MNRVLLLLCFFFISSCTHTPEENIETRNSITEVFDNVVLDIHITESGTVDDVKVKRSSGDKKFDNAMAKRALQTFKFEPQHFESNVSLPSWQLIAIKKPKNESK